MFSSLGSHVDVPEFILMALFYRFIRNLQIAIRDRKKHTSELGNILQGKRWEDHFEVKLRSKTCYLDFQNILQNKPC